MKKLDKKFVKARRGRGLCQPEGPPFRRRMGLHLQRHAGGGQEKLVAFMEKFEKENTA